MGAVAFRPAGRRRVLVSALSIATAVWLALQLVAGLRVNHATWPVTGFNMVSHSSTTFAQPRVDARLTSGQATRLSPEDFGLTADQWRRYLLREATNKQGGTLPGSKATLARLVAIWNRERPSNRIVEATLKVDLIPLQSEVATQTRSVTAWRSP
jgi:hypothetical protein